ncbi:DMT family transporter [Candidatus Merdisoma sp. HCP28S3_D10]|uniref:DMT family transporter n=1 Tax=unclassified Candidatus Merdisoma TaxID=3099611 RepID=UPI003F8CE7B3
MIGFFIALLSGALMSIQGVFNTEVTKVSSMWISAAWVQLTALVTCFLAWALTDRKNMLTVFEVTPRYMLLGGVIGAFITFTVIRSMDSLGPAKAVMLIVISQLLVAYLIELLGIFGVERADFSWRKMLGMAVAIVGVVIFRWE